MHTFANRKFTGNFGAYKIDDKDKVGVSLATPMLMIRDLDSSTNGIGEIDDCCVIKARNPALFEICEVALKSIIH